MSVGLPIADAIAIVEARGWHPPQASSLPSLLQMGPGRFRVRATPAYAEERPTSRWTAFMVDAAFRAATAAAVRHPESALARSV